MITDFVGQLTMCFIYFYLAILAGFVSYQPLNCGDVMMSVKGYQFTGVSIACSTVCSGANQRKHQSSASLAYVRGNHRSPVHSPHKRPVTRKIFPFDEVIILSWCVVLQYRVNISCFRSETGFGNRIQASICLWEPWERKPKSQNLEKKTRPIHTL